MASPPVINNDQPPLATHCLEFTKALVMQGVSFHFSITAGSFSFSFDNSKGNRNSDTAWTPAKPEKTRKTPSTLRRNARRKELFLKKKSETLSCIPSSQTEINHPQSQDNCPPSHDSIDNDNKVVHQNMGKGDWISNQRSHSPILQLDGNSDLSGEDDDQSQLNDTKDAIVDNHSDILCAMCNNQMTPTHQCCETNEAQPKPKHNKFVTLCQCEQALVSSYERLDFWTDKMIKGMLESYRLKHIINDFCRFCKTKIEQ